MIRLTPNFTLQELTNTNCGVSNEIAPRYFSNLEFLAQQLEGVRSLIGSPMVITSGYRNTKVNKKVGGVPTSAHLDGMAADFVCPHLQMATVFDKIKKVINTDRRLQNIDQLIFYPAQNFIHVGFAGDRKPRKQVFTK